jgi:N-methylhydantoinase A
VDEETGRTTTTKTPSTPADPAEGILTGVRKVLGLLGQPRASWLLPVW